MSPKVSPPVPKSSYPSATFKPLALAYCTCLHSTRTQAFGSGMLACWDTAGTPLGVPKYSCGSGIQGCKTAGRDARCKTQPIASFASSTPVPLAGTHFASISRVRVGPRRPSIPSSATCENRVPNLPLATQHNATHRAHARVCVRTHTCSAGIRQSKGKGAFATPLIARTFGADGIFLTLNHQASERHDPVPLLRFDCN